MAPLVSLCVSLQACSSRFASLTSVCSSMFFADVSTMSFYRAWNTFLSALTDYIIIFFSSLLTCLLWFVAFTMSSRAQSIRWPVSSAILPPIFPVTHNRFASFQRRLIPCQHKHRTYIPKLEQHWRTRHLVRQFQIRNSELLWFVNSIVTSMNTNKIHCGSFGLYPCFVL